MRYRRGIDFFIDSELKSVSSIPVHGTASKSSVVSDMQSVFQKLPVHLTTLE